MADLPAEIVVVIEDHTIVLNVTVSEVGLVGPPGTGGDPSALADHISSEEPHPVYDDGTSYLLRYENAKV